MRCVIHANARSAPVKAAFIVLGLAAALGACEEEKKEAREAPADEASLSASEHAARRAATMRREGTACFARKEPDRDPCRVACDLGHSNSCARLGRYLERGAGGARDAQAAVRRYREGCDGGSGLGCAALARRADQPAKARRLWRRARTFSRVHCEQGHRESCVLLARLYREGRGGGADPAAARHYLERACDLGAETACEASGD